MRAERILMILLLGVIAVGCGFVLYPFATALLWAAILTFSTWPLYQWIRLKLHLGRLGASVIMVLLAAVSMVLPFALIAPDSASGIGGLRALIDDWTTNGLPPAPDWLQNVPYVGAELVDRWNIWAADLSGLTDAVRPYAGVLAESGFRLLSSLAGGVARILLALFIAFFFWISGDQIAMQLRSALQRIAGPRADHMIEVTGRAVRGTVYAVLGTALVQGVLVGIGLTIAGVPHPVLFAMVAGFFSVLPIGPPFIWGPAAIWLYANHQTGHALFLVLWGVIAVAGADSLIRPYFIMRGARIPFLLTLLGVLGGAVAFGLLGVFLGPTLLAIGYSLVTEFAAVPPAAKDTAVQLDLEPL